MEVYLLYCLSEYEWCNAFIHGNSGSQARWIDGEIFTEDATGYPPVWQPSPSSDSIFSFNSHTSVFGRTFPGKGSIFPKQLVFRHDDVLSTHSGSLPWKFARTWSTRSAEMVALPLPPLRESLLTWPDKSYPYDTNCFHNLIVYSARILLHKLPLFGFINLLVFSATFAIIFLANTMQGSL